MVSYGVKLPTSCNSEPPGCHGSQPDAHQLRFLTLPGNHQRTVLVLYTGNVWRCLEPTRGVLQQFTKQHTRGVLYSYSMPKFASVRFRVYNYTSTPATRDGSLGGLRFDQK